MMRSISGKSSPLAATFVAIKQSTYPFLNCLKTFSLINCLISPCKKATDKGIKPDFPIRSTSLLVSQKIMTFPDLPFKKCLIIEPIYASFSVGLAFSP